MTLSRSLSLSGFPYDSLGGRPRSLSLTLSQEPHQQHPHLHEALVPSRRLLRPEGLRRAWAGAADVPATQGGITGSSGPSCPHANSQGRVITHSFNKRLLSLRTKGQPVQGPQLTITFPLEGQEQSDRQRETWQKSLGGKDLPGSSSPARWPELDSLDQAPRALEGISIIQQRSIIYEFT